MKERNLIVVFATAIVFYILCTMFNFRGISPSGIDEPYLAYYNNPTIKSIYILSIVLNVVGFLLLIYTVSRKSNYTVEIPLKISLALLILIQIFLIWYELYYGSTFSYGEVRDKQLLLFIGINNMGFVGSVILLLMLFNLFFKSLTAKTFVISNIIAGLVLVIGHVVAYKMLYESWKLWSS